MKHRIKNYLKLCTVITLTVIVTELTSILYGDYTDDEMFGRKHAMNQIIDILKSADEDEISVLGEAGNLYVLPYMELINNLSAV